MRKFDFNSFFASILIGLLCMQVFDLLSSAIIKPVYLAQNILGIDGGAAVNTAASDEKPLEPITPLLANANIANGGKIAKKCIQCHGFDKGGMHKTGPNLWAIVMNVVAHAKDFAYSKAMQTHGGKWDFESLNAFLHKPRKFMNGTKMSFVGLSSAQERADLIAYLRMQADSPVPIPAQ